MDKYSTSAIAGDGGSAHFLARQTIVDGAGEAIAVALVSRRPGDAARGANSAGQLADILFRVGLRRLTDGLPLILEADAEALESRWLSTLSVSQFWLLLRGPQRSNAKAISSLREQGFRLLCECRPGEAVPPPMDTADTIALIPIHTQSDSAEFAAVQDVGRCGQRLYTGVDKHSDAEALGTVAGCWLQGRAVAKAKLMVGNALPRLRKPWVEQAQMAIAADDLANVAQCMSRDLGMSLRFLQFVGQGVGAGRATVRSIPNALITIPEKERRWFLDFLATDDHGDSIDSALLRNALIKARFCELLVKECGAEGEAGEAFLVGLLSNIDVMGDQNVFQVMDSLPVVRRVAHAITEGQGDLGTCLAIANAYRLRRFYVAERLAQRAGLNSQSLARWWQEACDWADADPDFDVD